MKRCKKCLTPETYPGIRFDDDGVCNHCLEHYEAYKDWDKGSAQRQEYFERTIEEARKKKRDFDVLVPLSGGKDSTYILYLAAKVYGLKTLCYNFNNGLQSQIARDNIQAAIDATGAELYVFKPDEELLLKLYKHFLKHTGMFCPVCMRGISAGQFLAARKYNIPLVLKGTSVRTEERLVPEIFQDGSLSFFKNVLKKYPVEDDLQNLDYDRSWVEKLQRVILLLSNDRLKFGRVELEVPDYIEWNYDKIYETIIKDMGWNDKAIGLEHIDCLADPIVHHYIRGSRVPELTPSTLRYSAEIRVGQRDRTEALKLVEEELTDNQLAPEKSSYFLDRLDITEEELKQYMKNGRRHMQFQRPGLAMRLFHFIRSKVSSKSRT